MYTDIEKELEHIWDAIFKLCSLMDEKHGGEAHYPESINELLDNAKGGLNILRECLGLESEVDIEMREMEREEEQA